MVLQINIENKIWLIYKNSSCLVTLRLQEAWDTKAVMGYPEGILHILPWISQQSLPHVYQAGVNGLNDSQEGQTTCPTLSKVLNCHTIPITRHKFTADTVDNCRNYFLIHLKRNVAVLYHNLSLPNLVW